MMRACQAGGGPGAGGADHLHEYAVCQGQLPVTHGTPAANEVFVGEIRMELDDADLAVVTE